MKSSPEYRFECRIRDTQTGQTVLRADTYVGTISPNGECESVDIETGSLLRAFRSKRTRYESKNYN